MEKNSTALSSMIGPMMQLFSIHVRLTIHSIMVVRVYINETATDGSIAYSMDVTEKRISPLGAVHEDFIFNLLPGKLPYGYNGNVNLQKNHVLKQIIGKNKDEVYNFTLTHDQATFLEQYGEMIARKVEEWYGADEKKHALMLKRDLRDWLEGPR